MGFFSIVVVNFLFLIYYYFSKEEFIMSKDKKWYVYLLRCSDETLYCGITTDMGRRLSEHNHTARGSRYTRSRRPVELVGYFEEDSMSRALSAERKIKKLRREEKIAVFLK